MTALAMAGGQAEALLAARRDAGLDARDGVWDGVHHVAPDVSNGHSVVEIELAVLLQPLAMAAGLVLAGPLNIGHLDRSYRIPDLTVNDPNLDLSAASVESVRVAVEVLSPHDETFEKFDFYAAHQVDEILVADPDTRSVQCWQLTDGTYVRADSSSVLHASCTRPAPTSPPRSPGPPEARAAPATTLGPGATADEWLGPRRPGRTSPRPRRA